MISWIPNVWVRDDRSSMLSNKPQMLAKMDALLKGPSLNIPHPSQRPAKPYQKTLLPNAQSHGWATSVALVSDWEPKVSDHPYSTVSSTPQLLVTVGARPPVDGATSAAWGCPQNSGEFPALPPLPSALEALLHFFLSSLWPGRLRSPLFNTMKSHCPLEHLFV